MLLKPKFGRETARILIFDPDPTAAAIAEALDPPDYSTVVVPTGEQAIRCLEQEGPFRAFLVSVSGHSASKWTSTDTMHLMEQIKNGPLQLPMIAIGDASEVPQALLAMRAGAYDYLLRPVERTRLVTTIARATEHFGLMEQNREYRQNLEQMVSARTDMLREAISDLEESYDITLEALGDALDLKDAETEGHSRRVTAFTIALARGIGLDSASVRVIARGAFLHDIGKMAIPDAILLKPGKLHLDEQKLMREHCWRGYQILHKIPFLEEAAEIVYSHQEHFDGSGYPRGLKGEEIPLGARIFSIADTLDAITSDRPYRKAKSFHEAHGEIARCAGTQFDPSLVEAYLSMPDRVWEDLRKAILQQTKAFSPFTYAARKPRGTART